jgi:CheY-like chemotaxis protein
MKDVNLLISNGVDINSSLELFGDMETYNETLEDFLASAEEKLQQIQTYKETSDMPNYAILVHSLKSDSKYLGFTKLAELSYQHEMESKANNFNYVYDNYNELMTEANRIVNLVKQYLGKEYEKVTNEPAKQPIKIKDKAILVVDDSTLVRNLIQKVFNDEFEVILASDGKEALDFIETNNTDNVLGVLLDLNMPNVDGFEVLEYFKNNNLFTKIPVAIVTGDDSKETVNKAFAYPIVDVLNKPFNERDIKRIVTNIVNFK